MKKLFLFFVLLPLTTLAISFDVNDKAEFAISLQEKEVHISLPVEAQKALKKWNPQFSVFDRTDFPPSILQMFDEDKAQPMAFIADVEGNGKNALVLLGEDSKSQYVVALIQEKKSWKVIKVYSSSLPKIRKTEVPTLNEVKEVGVPFYILPAEGEFGKKLSPKVGIQVEAYLGIAEVYEIKDGKAQTVISQDDEAASDFTDIKK
jgi:hypothetical protein